MGYRLHVHTTHEIEYGKGLFNYDQYEINRMLFTLCNSTMSNGHNDYYDDKLEVLAEDFLNAIEKIKNMTVKQLRYFLQNCQFDFMGATLTDELVEDVRKTLCQGFQYIYDNYDKRNEYIYLTWY